LAAAGLLRPLVGGPWVKPYHPPGLYEQVVAQKDNPRATYEQGRGGDLLTRSLERFQADYAAAKAHDLADDAIVAQIRLCRDETVMRN